MWTNGSDADNEDGRDGDERSERWSEGTLDEDNIDKKPETEAESEYWKKERESGRKYRKVKKSLKRTRPSGLEMNEVRHRRGMGHTFKET